MSDVQVRSSTVPMSPQTMTLPHLEKKEAEFDHRTVEEVLPERTTKRIGLCGLGVVGCGTIDALGQNRTIQTTNGDITLVITHAGSRSGVPRYDIDETYREHIAFTQDVLDIPDQDDVDIVVDVTGGTRSKAVIEKGM
ncbi:hypothetical protein [Endozoicomonas atrinae]|uniref:hypothetical protein n=1 Tax=Endozoicomonas atrinae TaxID=1333660 RepID=UPI0008249BCF|nr:hypothetical protein [Endozoicomonas atrinae]